jgi:transcriptional regulator with XRE-family HTH domain
MIFRIVRSSPVNLERHFPQLRAKEKNAYELALTLKRLREARGYTQRVLGKLCGLSKTYISNCEQEIVNISLANLEALAAGLDCAEEDLLWRPAPPEARGAKSGGTVLSKKAL